MKRARVFVAGSALAVFLTLPAAVWGLNDYTWTGTVNSDWQQNGNWAPANFPNAGVDTATISVTPDLNLNLGASDVAVAALTLNGAGSSTDINLTSTGGRLVFKNDDDNTFVKPEPGIDVDNILVHEGVNHGRVYVTSNGAVGSTNTISAPVRLNNGGFLEGMDVVGSRSITFSGGMDIVGALTTDFGQIRSYLPTSQKVLITGNINLTDAGDNTTARSLQLNNYATADHSTPPRGTVEITGNIIGAGGIAAGWAWDVDGVEDGTNDVKYDPAPPPAVPFGTVILSGNNSFTGDVVMSRGNLVLRSDTALGAPAESIFRQSGQSGEKREVGYNLVVDAGDRTIANKRFALTENTTIKGNSSLNWTGPFYQDNGRTLINLLPYDHAAGTGKTLTFSGPVYPNRRAENPPNPGRFLTLDGTGRTEITGGIHDQLTTPTDDPSILNKTGFLDKRGTGTLVVDFHSRADITDTPTDYNGYTYINGGNLHFRHGTAIGADSNGDLPNGAILSTTGAVGVDDGVINNSAFLGLLNNSSTPNSPDSGAFFLQYGEGGSVEAIYTKYSEGGLMLGTLGTNEYTQNLDFNTAPLSNAANMTLAAHEGGSTYTGTITPKTTLADNPNTYQLGGGSGTLTLPNANQLTGGARNLLVTNGGEVALTNSNNYTGTTRVLAKYRDSLADLAAGDTGDPNNDGRYRDTSTQLTIGSTLTVSNLANGGSPSSIGSSANAATSLIVQGSTLKYVGGATSTDRLFTVGTAGATIDASGSGAVNFTNTGSLAIQTATVRTGLIVIGAPGIADNEVIGIASNPSLAFNTEDLVPGMRISDNKGDFNDPDHVNAGITPNIVVTAIRSPHVIQVGQINLQTSESDTNPASLPNRWTKFVSQPLPPLPIMSFGPAPARLVTLQGSNSGSNTLASVIGNASDIGNANAYELANGYGTVGIRKRGAGKWILTGNNTYSGPTNVEQGTLLVNGTHTGTGKTTVSPGATLGGAGTLGGSVVNNGTVAPGASAGTLTVMGNYTQWGGSTLAIELGGNIPGTYDLLKVLAGTPAAIQGDYNSNGTVDAADYDIWRDTLGSTSDLRANGDNTSASTNVVDQADFDLWKAHFGETTATGTAGLLGTLNISLINGFTPTPGDMFTVVTAVNGVNATGLTLSGQSSGFHLILNSNSIVLNYTGSGSGGGLAGNVPEPSSFAIAAIALLGLCRWGNSRRQLHG